MLILQNTRDTDDVDNHWVLYVVSGYLGQLQMVMVKMMVVVVKLVVVMMAQVRKRAYHYMLCWVYNYYLTVRRTELGPMNSECIDLSYQQGHGTIVMHFQIDVAVYSIESTLDYAICKQIHILEL
jgi:uncharacterized membrane-anchored protein